MENYIITKTTKREKIFSGIQPSGELHIGNYLGVIKSWVELQEKHDVVYCIVDYHALTEQPDPNMYKQQIFNFAVDLLSAGVDPKKSTIFVQSSRPEHTELCWLLDTIAPLAELQRVPTFKEKSAQFVKSVNMGLMNYPVLMAADILIYDATLVPVGEDQLPHIELTRELAADFNRRFGTTFVEPKAYLTKGAKIMSLSQPEKKMSKSLGPSNYIALRDDPKLIREKMMKAVTDIGPIRGKEMSPGVKNLFDLLEFFSSKDANEQFRLAYKRGNIKYSQLKEQLAKDIAEYLKPFRDNVKMWSEKPDEVREILIEGARKLEKPAQDKLKIIKEKMGLGI
jgi:tryptophanyl-tRNA synthetase